MSTPGTSSEKSTAPPVESHAPGSPAHVVEPASQAAPVAPNSPPATPARKSRWRIGAWAIGAVCFAIALYEGIPWLITVLTTVSTDDAYVNGHVTFVAPRVGGQVARVLVDDNNRVHKGDLLVELDKEPNQVQVRIAQSAVVSAQAGLVEARAQARGIVGKMRSLRFNLEHAIEDVNNQVAVLRAKVATLKSQRASYDKAKADFERGEKLVTTDAISKEDFDQRKEAMLVALAEVDEALEGVHQVRVGLGLPAEPAKGDDLAHVPEDLEQNFSAVKQAQGSLMQAAAQLGVIDSFDKSPRQMVADFYKRDPQGQIDTIYEKLLKEAPAVKQAEAKLTEAQSNLAEAELNLRYCNIVAEIDGVVVRRSVNPGNNVTVGQSLMAVRSLTEVWIDANFKETQLSYLRIGQGVDLDFDMYGRHQRFQGRISGFTMGTGSTLSLLPPQNATGNFVKVVQRLPVRIELLDYDPDKTTLFFGLSVTPHVRIREQPTGPDAGKVLQPYLAAEAISRGSKVLP
jgi:membrane fusion protein (multidrug efflux system)